MRTLVDAEKFLYIDNPDMNLYLHLLQEYISILPKGLLKIDEKSKPIITEFKASIDAPHYYITIGYGFHNSQFRHRQEKPRGLAFSLNPPYISGIEHKIRNILMCGFTKNASTFTIDDYQFLLSNEQFDLDRTITRELDNGQIYKKEI